MIPKAIENKCVSSGGTVANIVEQLFGPRYARKRTVRTGLLWGHILEPFTTARVAVVAAAAADMVTGDAKSSRVRMCEIAPLTSRAMDLSREFKAREKKNGRNVIKGIR